jgi:hypothetical protein
MLLQGWSRASLKLKQSGPGEQKPPLGYYGDPVRDVLFPDYMLAIADDAWQATRTVIPVSTSSLPQPMRDGWLAWNPDSGSPDACTDW